MGFIQFRQFINNSFEPYTVTKNLITKLNQENFQKLDPTQKWQLIPGNNYYLDNDLNSVIAFKVGSLCQSPKFKIVASHLDSPNLRIKPNGIISNPNYGLINTEVYGGPIYSTWFDRPLGISGGVVIKDEQTNQLKKAIVTLDLTVVIPSLAIHLNREANSGYRYNPQIDLLPILTTNPAIKSFKEVVANSLKVDPDQLIAYDLSLYNKDQLAIIGLENNLFTAPRIDNLESTYASFEAFNQAYDDHAINVYISFNHEEIGSTTKQGADSPYLENTLKRIVYGLGHNEEEYICSIARSFFVSADNAHAIPPHHPQKVDSGNNTKLNQGVVIKHSARQRYTTTIDTQSVIIQLCEQAGLKYQHFANRSDEPGGSTLGCLNAGQINIKSVDIGLPQLAMHSANELAGVEDYQVMVDLLTAFYNHNDLV